MGGVDVDTGFTDGNPHCIVMTMDGPNQSAKVYLDGVSQNIKVVEAGTPDNFANFQYDVPLLGRNVRTAYDSFFDGRLYEMAVWNSILTETEANLYCNSYLKRIALQIDPDNLVGYWPLDDYPEGHGTLASTTWKDLSGNGNDGTGVDADNDSDTVAESVLTYP